MTRRLAFFLLGLGGLAFLAGLALGDMQTVARQMTYGNFDVPGEVSFVNQLSPGIPDHASGKVYTFSRIHWLPLLMLVGVVFPGMWLWATWRNREPPIHGIRRCVVQWASFVWARLGVIRVSGLAPMSRSCFGIFPFLNCQACEMASGACPIGMLQGQVQLLRVPFLLIGTLLVSGILLGRAICGWLCPFGLVSDVVDRISLRKFRVPRRLNHGRYWMLGALLAGALLYGAYGITDSQFFCRSFCASGKILGLAPYYLTTGAPSFFAAATWWNPEEGLQTTVFAQVALTFLFLVAMLLFSGRIFCRVLCPLGGLWGLFGEYSVVGVRHRPTSCQSCGRCERICPMGVSQEFRGFLDTSSCIVCGRCVAVCASRARSFRVGWSEQSPDTGRSFVGENALENYGGLYNRLRRDAYLVIMSVMARSPLSMAQYAFRSTEFYKNLYGEEPLAFESLPLARKQDLGAASPYDLLSKDYTGSVILYGETTGSTGNPTPVFFTPLEFGAGRIFSRVTPYVGLLAKVLEENRAAVNGLTFGFTIAGLTFGDFLQANGAMVAQVGSRSTIATPERMARALKRLQPSVLTGTPIDILCWLRILKEDHPAEYQQVLGYLRAFLTTAELCSSSRRRAMEREFNVTHVDIYACVEGFFAIPCPCGEKHVLPSYYTEVFDDELHALGKSGSGRLAFTHLVKKSSPLVRYLLDDYVDLFPSQCPYGFMNSVEPHGRWELTVNVAGKRLGVRHFEEAIFKHGLFGDYRVVLESDRVCFTLEEYASHAGVPRIREALSDEFAMPAEVEIVPFGTLTAYREVRQCKPILKVTDRRPESTQKIPEFL